MKDIPYWQDHISRPRDIPFGALPREVDVAVVGSGFSGLNAAIVLAKSGARVAVLEKNTIGWGSASRNGGFVAGLFGEPDSFERKFGLETARALWRWSLRSLDFVEQMVAEENIDCDFQRSGNLYLAYKPSHFRRLLDLREKLASKYDDHNYQVIEPQAMESEIGSKAFYGALLDESGRALNPAKYVYGLARAAAKYGVQLIENAEVCGIRRQNHGFLLSTLKGRMKAREVLLATNGYTTSLIPELRNGVILGGGYCTVTEPLSQELQRQLSPKGRGFFDTRFFFNYFRLIASGRLLFGGWKTLVRDRNPEIIGRKIHTRILQVFPQLKGLRLTHAWTGRFAFTFDMLPHIGRVDGVHYALGCNGHGVGTMSYLGHEAGQWMAGKIDRSLFAEFKHPRHFFAPWDQWYWPAVCGWFRLKDWLS